MKAKCRWHFTLHNNIRAFPIPVLYKMLQKIDFKKEVGIAIKSKETSLETASYHLPAGIGYCWFDHMQTNACTNNAFSSISTRFNIAAQDGTKFISEHTSESSDNILQICQRMHYLYIHLATYGQVNSNQCWLVDNIDSCF